MLSDSDILKLSEAPFCLITKAEAALLKTKNLETLSEKDKENLHTGLMLVLMSHLLQKAKIKEEQLNMEFDLRWNFSDQYLRSKDLRKEIEEMPAEFAFEIARFLNG